LQLENWPIHIAMGAPNLFFAHLHRKNVAGCVLDRASELIAISRQSAARVTLTAVTFSQTHDYLSNHNASPQVIPSYTTW